MNFFKGKLAYITGGSSGIGFEIAKELARQGCSLVLFARKQPGLDSACEKIRAELSPSPLTVDSLPMDVADNDDVKQKIGTAVERFGIPDILVNSAGVSSGDYFENITCEQFDRVMKINVYGPRNTIHALLPFMKQNRGGHIVNISSEAGLIGMFGYSLYSTTKYALVGLSECIRSEFKLFGIHVTVVCPPEVKTPFIEDEARTMPPEGRAVKNLAGLLKPEHVARATVRAIRRKKFMVVPGLAAKFLYFQHRISNGFLTRFPSDIITGFVARRSGCLKKDGSSP